MPVPSSCLISMPCSSAILRTSGLDFVRRNSSALAPGPASEPASLGGAAADEVSCRAGSSRLTSGFTAVLPLGAFGAPCSTVVIAGFGGSIVGGGAGVSCCFGASALAGSGVSCSVAAAVSTVAGFAPLPSSTATTVFTSTVSPSLALISVRVPAAGEGISASTLSVEISNKGSSRST